MKNKVQIFIVLMVLLTSAFGFSQKTIEDVTIAEATVDQGVNGTWFWVSPNGENNFELTLVGLSGNFAGQHCSVFDSGSKMDCSDGETSVRISETSSNIFEGTIISGFSNTSGKIKLKYDPELKRLYFYLVAKPTGINYIPKEIVLER